ncbi:MAG: DUF4304 domain-containing protein [Actinomycetota bacterium]
MLRLNRGGPARDNLVVSPSPRVVAFPGSSAQHSFRQLLKPVAAFLRRNELKGSGQRFMLVAASGDQALVNIQKSTTSTSSVIRFAVNVGVVSKWLWEWEYEDQAAVRRPDAWSAHWHDRLSDPNTGQERWWEVTSTSDPMAIANEVIELLEQQALPRMLNLLKDEELVKLWRSGSSPGLTAKQASEYLAALESHLRSG